MKYKTATIQFNFWGLIAEINELYVDFVVLLRYSSMIPQKRKNIHVN